MEDHYIPTVNLGIPNTERGDFLTSFDVFLFLLYYKQSYNIKNEV